MKKTRNWKWIVSIGTSLMFLFTFIFSLVGGGLFSSEKGGLSSNEPITAQADSSFVTRPSGATFGQFIDGYSYVYTDKTKITSMRNGSIVEDFKSQPVNTSATHGTADNPYVIATVEDWENFAKYAGSTVNNTTGKVFVLANDIDFADVTTFRFIPCFGGSFYGQGRTLSNIKATTWQYWNGSAWTAFATMNTINYAGFGLFGYANNATITDVILENFAYSGMPSIAGIDSAKTWGDFIGGITGVPGNATNILNCHAQGSITGGKFTVHTWNGGIAGMQWGVGGMLYRCSADVTFNISTTLNPHSGSIIGDVYTNGSVTIYDCVANSTYTVVSAETQIGGVLGYDRAGSTVIVENVITYIKLASGSGTMHYGAFGGYLYQAGTLKFNNVYLNSSHTSDTANVPFYNYNKMTTTATNVTVGPYITGYPTGTNVKTSRDDVIRQAKSDVGSKLQPAIWNAEKLTTCGMGTFTPDNTPVRSYLKTSVTYWNYKGENNDAVQYPVNNSYDPIEVKAEYQLCTPDDISALKGENRQFLGWTTDTSGNGAIYTEVPYGLYGDVKLYAVWKPEKATLSVTASGSGDFESDPATREHSVTYNQNGITLRTALSVPNMSGPTSNFMWYKDGDTPQEMGTTANYTVKNVRDSGKYYVKIKFHDDNEPLFMGEISNEDVKDTVTINPSPLTCTGVTFEDGPWSGAPYDTAVPDAIVKDKDGLIVKGVTSWSSDLGNFNNLPDNEENIKDGWETKRIKFTPDEEYGGNYGDTVYFDVTFEIKYLTFTFNIPRLDDLKLVVRLEYGQHYTYNNVVTLFEDEFEPYLGQLGGYTPAFDIDGQVIKINDYRKKTGANGSTTAYASVKESYEIEVTFVPQTYTVTFDARNGGETPKPSDLEIGHGIRIPKPTDPTYGNQLFLGWFYDYTDADGKTETAIAWNFDIDRVTHELDLYAKWLQADKLIGLTVKESPLAQYVAKQGVEPEYFTVKAIFQGTDEDTGTSFEQEVLLSYGQYQISFEGGASVLHAKEDSKETTKITFSYSFKLDTAEAELNVIVEKIKLDTSVLKQYFKDTAVVKTGGPQTMKEIDPQRISQLLPEIAGCEVTYKYYNSQEREIDPSQVVNVATYYVRAYFKPDDTDYEAPYIQAIFQIVNEKIKLTIEWSEIEFTFNGKEQIPVPTFRDELGDIITANYVAKVTRISNTAVEVEAIKARTDYMVTIVLEDLAYEIIGDESTPFAIMPATLSAPTQLKYFPYVGAEYDLNALSASECEVYFDGLDLDMMYVNFGENVKGDKGKDAGRYNATIILRDPDSSKFEDGTTRTTMTWQIEKAKLTVEWSSYEFYENNGIQIPTVQTLYEFYGDDGKLVDLSKDIEYMGDITAMTSGEYTITVIIKPEAVWISNYELDKSKTCTFVILPRAGMEAISLEWDSTTLFTYNGNVQKPSFKVKNRVGAYVELDAGEFRYNDESQNSRWAGDYEMIVSLRPGSNYFLIGTTNCLYTIIVNAAGEGNRPSDDVGTTPPDDGNIGDGGNKNTAQLPLWQLIVTGFSAIFFIICTAKSFGEYGKLKAARREAKELAAVSYAVTYGFAPLPLLAEIAFLGMGEGTWTVIAFVALGVFLVSLAAMLLLSKKRKAAELIVKREQARIEEEKEFARQEEQMRRDEEQRRRDDELKMMFASMQQGGMGGGMQYNDMRALLTETVSALLPTVSQQMAALPPAQSDANAYADPYTAPAMSSEAEALRAQMAQQQEMMAQQQAQMAQQQAQMAQQQALINQLLQNQQQQAADYDEDEHDEAQWQDDADEVISLEELYGKLTEEAKRFYYDIGSYIMSKSRVHQNDGKYAVLFKYRGKTLFKLCIKNDAPVLYYKTDSGVKEAIRIADAAGMSSAKSVIDMCVSKRDRELS